jgi:SGNH domain (fused to AT3 domains)
MAGFRQDNMKICSFGPSDGETVILLGDSHAEQWLPALLQVAQSERWHLLTLLKASCPSATVPVYNPRLEREEYECATWRAKALSYIREIKPSIVLTSNALGYVKRPTFHDPYARLSLQTWEDGTRSTLRSLNDAATLVVLLRDTPRPEIDVPTCLSRVTSHPLLFPGSTCKIKENEALPQEIWQVETSAAQQFAHVSVLDMSSFFCHMGDCPPMLNGLVVYRDGNHMTSSFASSLAPSLARELRAIQLHNGSLHNSDLPN